MFKPETYQPLNEEDHQKIRKVTAWLWLQKDSVNSDSFSKILKNNDFDKRFDLVSSSTGTDSKDIQVDVETLLRMFKKYQWTNSFPQFCQFNMETNVSASTCSSEITADIRDYNISDTVKMKSLYMKIKVTRSADKKILEQEFYYPLARGSSAI